MDDQSDLFRPLKTVRIFEEIASQIREHILTGVLKPGDKLPSERELAQRFRVGRMVLREALRILEQAGFICIRQGSEGGAFVKEIDTTAATRSIEDLIRMGHLTVRDLTEARLGLEKMIVELAVERANREILDKIALNVEESERMVERGERPKEENLTFHILIAQATGNPVYEILIRSLMQILDGFIKDFNPDEAYLRRIAFYHREIYAALVGKDRKKALQNIEAHLTTVYEHLA